MTDSRKPEDSPSPAARQRYCVLELTGDGPFELPKCRDVSVLTEDDQFLLRLEISPSGQAVFVPLQYEAVASLEVMLRYLIENHADRVQAAKH